MANLTQAESLHSLRRRVERLRWGPDASQLPRLIGELIRLVEQMQERLETIESDRADVARMSTAINVE
jgi:hypothetical protein